MSRSVLLISYHFAPQNTIGAVRPTKVAKYLTRMGYDVTVLCGVGLDPVQDPLLQRDMAELEDVRILRERSLLRWWKTRGAKPAASAAAPVSPAPAARPAAGKSPSTRKNPLLDALYLWLVGRADAAFARACLRELRRMNRHFDVVLSTYGPVSVHTVARRVKQARMADRWIADFRDEVAAPFPLGPRWTRRYVQAVRRHADAVTAASLGYLKVMGLEEIGLVIHNGFDREDIAGMPPPQKRDDRLTFIHSGQMYGRQRDLSPFFLALRELADEGLVDPKRVELAYLGRDTGGFVEQATAAGLASCLKGYGYVRRDVSLGLQRSAHVLLLAAWNRRDKLGNLPGKLLEFMMLDMPVICCVSGDVPDSEVAGILRRTGLGFCYEQSRAAEDAPALKRYILSLYRAFAAGEAIPFSPDPEAVAAFSSQKVAEAFARQVDRLSADRGLTP